MLIETESLRLSPTKCLFEGAHHGGVHSRSIWSAWSGTVPVLMKRCGLLADAMTICPARASISSPSWRRHRVQLQAHADSRRLLLDAASR